jgi:UDP-N-acetylmuramoylalanine--D-glutamate ligase
MRLVVLGGGESGVGTAILGQKGYDVFVSDFGKIKTSTNKFLQIMVSTGRMKTY